MRPELVVDFDRSPEPPTTLVGGKGAGLARLIALGIPVPRSFAITTRAFRAFCETNGIDRTAAPAAVAREIRSGGWPVDLQEAVDRALAAIPGDAVAVRSSATCEDGERFSLAGQFASRLFVPRADVPAAVASCWASLFDGPARAYLARMDAPDPDMAVILQEQVRPAWSGVAFTLDPVTRSLDEVAVEWVEGTGIDLVQGRVDPGRVSLPRRATVVAGDLPEPLRRHLVPLRDFALRVERALGRPVDVEWCATPERLLLLQARPVTAALGPGDVLWSNVNLAENFPAPLAPLAWSMLERFYGAYVRSALRALGWSDRDLRQASHLTGSMTGIHRGRIHYRLDSWYGLVACFPWGEALTDFLDAYIGQDVRVRPAPDPATSRLRSRSGRPAAKLRFLWRVAGLLLRTPGRLGQLEARLGTERRDWRRALREARDPRAAGQVLSRALALVDDGWRGPCGADVGVAILTGLLGDLVERWSGRRRDDVLPTLLSGVEVRSDEPARILWLLSRVARERGDAVGDAAAWRAGLGPAEARLLDDFLERFGSRCTSDCVLSSQSYVERPDLVLSLVRGFQALPDALAPHAREGLAAQRGVLAGNLAASMGPVRRRCFRAVHRASLLAIQRREEGRMLQSCLFGELRAACLRTGELLAAAGAIPERDDVFELTGEEVRSLAQGTCPYPEGLAAVRAERRRLRAEAATVPPPSLFVLRAGEVLAGAGGPRAPARPPGASPHRLVGLPVSRGLVRGRARVVHDPVHETVAPGEILVAECADPGWTPLIFLSGGLVLERGGMLSHGAIVAREAGIPGIVQVRDASREIANGDDLVVDANAGTVLVEAHDG
jgi:pyruvate,water dikinase